MNTEISIQSRDDIPDGLPRIIPSSINALKQLLGLITYSVDFSTAPYSIEDLAWHAARCEALKHYRKRLYDVPYLFLISFFLLTNCEVPTPLSSRPHLYSSPLSGWWETIFWYWNLAVIAFFVFSFVIVFFLIVIFFFIKPEEELNINFLTQVYHFL